MFSDTNEFDFPFHLNVSTRRRHAWTIVKRSRLGKQEVGEGNGRLTRAIVNNLNEIPLSFTKVSYPSVNYPIARLTVEAFAVPLMFTKSPNKQIDRFNLQRVAEYFMAPAERKQIKSRNVDGSFLFERHFSSAFNVASWSSLLTRKVAGGLCRSRY